MSALRLATTVIMLIAGATTAPSTAAQSPGGVSQVNDEVVTALRRTVEAQASRIEAQASEIAALRVGSAAAGQQPTAATSRRHLASKVSPDFRAATAKKNNRARTPDFEMEHLNRMGELRDLIMNEGLPGEEARRHLHDNPLYSDGSSDDEVDLHLRALFQRVDANHSGHIDRDEVAEMARSLGHHMTKSELDASMSLMDPLAPSLQFGVRQKTIGARRWRVQWQ
eukprot:COSAG01_NODE_12602_length_1712_cov_8.020459_1_plen_225_part_00